MNLWYNLEMNIVTNNHVQETRYQDENMTRMP